MPTDEKAGGAGGGDEVGFEVAAVKDGDRAAGFADEMVLMAGAAGQITMVLGGGVDGVDGADPAEGVEGAVDGAASGLEVGVVEGGEKLLAGKTLGGRVERKQDAASGAGGTAAGASKGGLGGQYPGGGLSPVRLGVICGRALIKS